MSFLTTPTVSSADDLVGLLHPTADHGVHPVSCRLPTLPPTSDIPHGRLTLRSFPLPTRWTPSPNHCWSVHRMSSPSRGWPSSVLRTGRNLHALRKSPPPQGFPDGESVAGPPRCRDGLPDAPLGFSPTPGFHLSLCPVTPCGRSRSLSCSAPDRSREPPDDGPAEAHPPYRPDRRSRAFHRCSSHRSGHRMGAGPRDRAHALAWAPHEASFALALRPSKIHRCRWLP